MGKIADLVARMLAEGARSAAIVEAVAKAEAKEEKAAIEAWRIEEAFEVFWKAYPNKTGKPDAKKAFGKVLHSFPLEQIMLGVARYVQSKPADRPWLNAATFLRQERFNDEPAPVARSLTGVAAAKANLRKEIENERTGQAYSDPRYDRGLPFYPDQR